MNKKIIKVCVPIKCKKIKPLKRFKFLLHYKCHICIIYVNLKISNIVLAEPSLKLLLCEAYRCHALIWDQLLLSTILTCILCYNTHPHTSALQVNTSIGAERNSSVMKGQIL